ncbi:15-hydroxyprostaglandin dehydrogenase [Caerostris darwini]|uniref:15-hydroxyprostaglandin dehydrogenase [NAD(+)] n=1 Tax=Caerostris darwini TaxID=1538125 RepID=A0AAV4U8Z7_9ARAC|nr:15-hydroxyprostaglandin dehydrogenase [Caerostris darwini]
MKQYKIEKVALVTGGSQGIGRAYTEALLNLGMKVCICDIKEDAALELMQNLPADLKTNIVFQKCDVSSSTDLKNAFDYVISTFGRLDMLINNAGIYSEQNYQKMIEINFIAVVNATKIAFELMNVNNGGSGGHIINTASEAGLLPLILGPVYTGTKHAIVGFTKSLGTDYHFKKTGITVNAICPGPVDTYLFQTFAVKSPDQIEAEKLISSVTPVKPEEVGKALLKLLEDNKNGALLRVDAED